MSPPAGAGAAWLQVKCHRCETEASIPLEHVRRPRDTPIWKLEAALKCRSCRTPRYSPRVHMTILHGLDRIGDFDQLARCGFRVGVGSDSGEFHHHAQASPSQSTICADVIVRFG
jgi:hypothetical protein